MTQQEAAAGIPTAQPNLSELTTGHLRDFYAGSAILVPASAQPEH